MEIVTLFNGGFKRGVAVLEGMSGRDWKWDLLDIGSKKSVWLHNNDIKDYEKNYTWTWENPKPEAELLNMITQQCL